MAKTKKRANEYSSSSHIDLNHPEKYLPKSEWNKPLQQTIKQEQQNQILKDGGITPKSNRLLDLNNIDLDSFGQGQGQQAEQKIPDSAFKISKADVKRGATSPSDLMPARQTQSATDRLREKRFIRDNALRELERENSFDSLSKRYFTDDEIEDGKIKDSELQSLYSRYGKNTVDEFLSNTYLSKEYVNDLQSGKANVIYKFEPLKNELPKLQAGNREEYNQLISALEKDRQRISDSKDLSRGDKMAINHLKKLTQELYDAPTKDEGMAITNALEGTYEKSIGDRDFWTAGITELARNYKIENSAERFKNEYQRLAKEYANRGDKNWKEKARDNAFNNLSVSDREKLNAYMDFVEAGKVRKDDLSTAYQIGETIGGSLGFMVNMFLGSGATNLVRNGVRSIAKTSSKKFAKSIVKGIDKQILKDEVVARGINIPANATSGEVWRATGKYFKELGKTALKPGQAIITTAVNPRTYANVAEKKTQKFVQGEDATFGDVAAAVVESHIENWSEVYGGKIFSPFFKSIFKGTPFFKQATKLGSEKFDRTAIGKAFNDLRSNKFNQFLRNKGHFGDSLEEFEEEYVGGLVTSLYGTIAENIPFLNSEFAADMKSNFSDMFSSDETGMLVGSILPMEILLKGVPLARSFRREMNMMGYNDAVSNLRTVLQNNGYQNADNLISAVETAIATDNVYKKYANGNTTNDFTDDFAELIGATVETFNNTADNNVQSAFNNYLNEAKNVGKYISDNLSFFNHLDEDEKQEYLNDILKEVQQKATVNILYNNLRKAKMYNVFNSETGEYENRVLQIYDKSSGETWGIVTDYDKDSKTFTIIPEYSNSPVQVTMDDFKKNNLGVLHERADVLLDELSQVIESNSKEGSYIHTRLALNDFIEYDGQQAYITEVQDKDGTPYFVKDLDKARQTGGTVGVKTYNPQTNTWDTQIVNVSDLDESTANRRLFDEFADETYQTQKDLINQTRQITQELSQSQQQAEQQTQQPQSETTDNNSDLIDSNIIQGNEYDKSYTNNLKAGDKITIHASKDNDNDNIDELDGKQVSVVSLQEGYRNDVRSITIEDTEGNRYDLPVISNNSDWSFTYNGSETRENETHNQQTQLNEQQVENLVELMNNQAEQSQDIELNADNWIAQFGKDGKVKTPLGEVKMGENQMAKLILKKRENEFGMILPTLTNPDVIIEEKSRAKDGQSERDFSYLFIKTFNKDGKKIKFYASISVQKDGMEVIVSNHYMELNAVKKKLLNNNVKYIKGTFTSNGSDWHLTKDSKSLPDLLPTQNANVPLTEVQSSTSSESKITTKSLNDKIKSGEILSQNAEDTLVELYSQMSKEDAQEVVNGIIKQAEAKQKQLAKKSINYEDIDKFQKHKQQIKETEKKLAYWNEVKSLFTAPQSQVEEVQNLKSIGEKEKTLGQAYSMREYILRHLVLGGKFIWNDNENGTKGLGSHLGLSNSTEERRNYFAFLAGKDKKGVYPEVYAENLLTDVRENINPNAEFDEVFNEMIDCLSSFSTPTAMMNEAVRLHYETEDDLIQNDFEKQQQEINDSAEEQEISRLTEQQLKENALSPEEYDNLQRQRIEEEQRKTDISTENSSSERKKYSSERNQQNGTSQKTKSNTVTDNVNNYLQTIDNLKRDIVERALQHSTTLNRNGENVKMTVAEYIDYCIRNGIEIEDNGRFRPVVMDYYRWAKDNYIKQQKASDSTQQETTAEDKALLDAVVDKLKEAIGEENVITDNSEAQRILDEANGKERRISEQIKQIFDDVIKGKIKGKPVKIGNLSKDGKAYLEQISGLKFKDNCRFVLNPSDLLHIYNNHFGNNEKDKGNNIPLTMHDIKRIADVISFPTEIIAGQNEQGKNMFYFLMESSNGTYNLLEVYADRNGNLTAKTFYKTKKSVSQRAINLRNSLHSTSSTDGATLSNAKIPQIFDLPNKNTAKQQKINDSLDLRNAIKDITGAKGYETNSAYVRGTSKNGTTYEIRVGNHIANFENFDKNNEELPQKIVSIVLLDEKFDRKNARFQSSEEINRELDSQNIDCEFEQVIIDDIENKTQEELQHILDNISFSTKVLKERGRLMFEDDSNIRFHKVYHGSGAEFDTFDHSHMGEGEGAQAFGWGSYVTEVEEIGRTYAEQATPIVRYNGSTADTYKNYEDRSVTEDAAIRVMDNFQRSDYDIEQAISLSIEELESYGGDEYSEELDALQQMSADDFDVEIPDYNLYTVEIPDDNGKNYLFWEQDYDENEISSLVKQLSKYDSNDFDFDYLSEKIEDYLDQYNMTGEGLYKLIQRYGFNNNAQKTSEILNKLGFVGISYPTNTLHGGNTDGTRNYVIFNEKDLKITDHVKFFKTKDGQAYGFTANGKIYIDTSIAKADTPIHEYTHLWAEALKQNNPEEWKNIVDLMKKEKILWDKIKQDYPELTTDDELADEVLAHYSGENGKKRLEEEVKNIKANNKQSIFDKAKMVNAVNNVKKALERFWKGVASFFNVHFTSAQDLADTILSDFLNGVNPNENIQEKTDRKVKTDKENNAEEQEIINKAKADGSYMKAPNGKETNLTERQWVQVRTKAFKDWFGDWEKSARIEKLRKSESISITGKEIPASEDIAQYRRNAQEYGNTNLRGEYTNKDTGKTVSLGRKGIKEVLHHDYKDIPHIQSIAAIPQIIENSVYIDTIENENPNKTDVSSYDYYVCGLKINGEDYTVKAVISNMSDGSRYYDHKLTQIEKGKLLDGIKENRPDGERITSPLRQDDFNGKDTRLFSILQENSSKVVDENGEPLVVYHTSNNKFTAFDKSKIGSMFIQKSFDLGFYFTNNPLIKYGKNEYFVFLNLKKPLYITDEGWGTAIDQIDLRKSDINRWSKENGSDGIIVESRDEILLNENNEEYTDKVYVALNPNQIKSATDNIGTFSKENNDIRYNKAKPTDNKEFIDDNSTTKDFDERLMDTLTLNFDKEDGDYQQYNRTTTKVANWLEEKVKPLRAVDKGHDSFAGVRLLEQRVRLAKFKKSKSFKETHESPYKALNKAITSAYGIKTAVRNIFIAKNYRAIDNVVGKTITIKGKKVDITRKHVAEYQVIKAMADRTAKIIEDRYQRFTELSAKSKLTKKEQKELDNILSDMGKNFGQDFKAIYDKISNAEVVERFEQMKHKFKSDTTEGISAVMEVQLMDAIKMRMAAEIYRDDFVYNTERNGGFIKGMLSGEQDLFKTELYNLFFKEKEPKGTTHTPQEVINEIESYDLDFDSINKTTNKLIEFINKFSLSSKIIDTEEYNYRQLNGDYWVPLRGWDGEMYSVYGQASGTQKTNIRANGRKTVASDPMPYIYAMVESTVDDGVYSSAKRVLKDYLMRNADILKENDETVTYMYRFYPNENGRKAMNSKRGNRTFIEDGETGFVLTDKKPRASWIDNEKSIIHGNTSEITDAEGNKYEHTETGKVEVVAVNEDFNKLNNGLVFKVFGDDKKYERLHNETLQPYIWTFRDTDGTIFRIALPDKSLVKTLNTPKIRFNEAFANPLLRDVAMNVKNLQSKMVTSYSLKFAINNIFKDLPMAMAKEVSNTNGYVGHLFSEFKNIGRVAQYIFNPRGIDINKMSTKDKEVYLSWLEWQTLGGMSGVSSFYNKDVDNVMKRLEADMDRTKWSKAKKVVGLKYVSDCAELGENLIRFASYRAFIKSGLNKNEAAYQSKEVTLNYSRQGKVSQKMNLFYTFYSATMNACYKLARLLINNPKGYFKFFTYFALVGVGKAIISHSSGDDDKDKSKYTSPYKQLRHLYVPFSDGFYIPFPHEAALPFALGQDLTKCLFFDEINGSKVLYDMTQILPEHLPQPYDALLKDMFKYNQTTGNMEISVLSKDYRNRTVSTLSPSAITPLVDVLVLNEDFMGGNIIYDNWNGQEKTRAGRSPSYDNTYIASELLAEGYNKILNWDLMGKNKIDYLDAISDKKGNIVSDSGKLNKLRTLAPEDIQYIAQQYVPYFTGVVGKAVDVGNMVIKKAFGDDAGYKGRDGQGQTLQQAKEETRKDSKVKVPLYDDPIITRAYSTINKEVKRLETKYKDIKEKDLSEVSKQALEKNSEYQAYKTIKRKSKKIRNEAKKIDAEIENLQKSDMPDKKQKVLELQHKKNHLWDNWINDNDLKALKLLPK